MFVHFIAQRLLQLRVCGHSRTDDNAWEVMKTILAAIFIVSLIVGQASSKPRTRRQSFVFPEDGESCITPTNGAGICIPLSRCESLRTSTDFNFLRNSICGYDRDMPRVCCPSAIVSPTSEIGSTTISPGADEITTVPSQPTIPVTIPPTTRRNATDPTPPVTNTPPVQKPAILPKECGRTTVTLDKVVGGTPVELGAWPWMAAVYLTRSGLSRGTDCGGALVTPRHVITAAHCVTDRRGNLMSASDFTVRVGEHVLNDENDGASPVDFPVVKIVRHENFQRRVFKNDIAILTLERNASFNRLIRPICLPYGDVQNINLTQTMPWVAGWGTTAFEGEYSPILSQIRIPVWTNENCHRVYQRERVAITQEYLCAGVSDGTKDSCQGDSGGPLMLPDSSGRFNLIGIVSFGKRCATIGYPGVYTRVTIYLDWIAKNLT